MDVSHNMLLQVFDKAASAIGASFTELPQSSGEVRTLSCFIQDIQKYV